MGTIKQQLAQAFHILKQAGGDTPRLDAEVLLAHVLRRDRAWLYAHSEQGLLPEALRQFNSLLRRRLSHEPVAYIIGRQEFYGLSFFVSPQVLIPRPETELLVEAALNHLPPNGLLLDIGTGSGCIAVSVAVHAPLARLIATDLSAGALQVARLNVQRHNVTRRVLLLQADLLTAITGPFHVIVSNPPYVTQPEMATLAPDVQKFEPAQALTGGGSGLALIQRILMDAPRSIKPGGTLLVEIGAAQAKPVMKLAKRFAPQAKFAVKQDLAGRDRLLIGQF